MRRRGLIRGVCLELVSSDTDSPCARLGLIVPKRLAKRAVLRNLIKRQVRECFRLRAGQLPVRDIVVRLARPLQVEGAILRQALRAELETLFDKLSAQDPQVGR